MNAEIFFEINGTPEEQQAVARKIALFLNALDAKGDISSLDGNPEEFFDQMTVKDAR